MADGLETLNAELIRRLLEEEGLTLFQLEKRGGGGVAKNVWRRVLAGKPVRRSSRVAIASYLKVEQSSLLLLDRKATLEMVRGRSVVPPPKPDSVPDAAPRATPDRFETLFSELNTDALQDPELLGVYDLDPEPHPKDKLHVFAYKCLNAFENGYELYKDRDVRDPLYKSWYNTLKDFVNKSSWAQNILLRKDSEEVYDAGFLAFAKSLIQN